MDYAIWTACCRVGVRPPGCEAEWEDCNPETQAAIIEFDRIRSHDEVPSKPKPNNNKSKTASRN